MPIQLHTWDTPNGRKISVALEEMGLAYSVHPIDISKGKQFEPAFLKISPNNRIPAIIDSEGPGGKEISVFESGAIMMYLAEKHGRFWPQDTTAKYDVAQWLMFQMASVGPMLGQAHHFLGYAPEKIPYAMDRYRNEANRLYGVIDRRLGESEYIACDEYTIADMAVYPWLRMPAFHGVNIDEYPNVKRWRDGDHIERWVGSGLLVAERQFRKVIGHRHISVLLSSMADATMKKPIAKVADVA